MTKKMSRNRFVQIYNELPSKAPKAPKSAFVEEIAALCNVTAQAVRLWIAGTTKPNDENLRLISQHLGVPERELF